MQKILISACLVGVPVRYNGLALTVESGIVDRWVKAGQVITFCPEVSGGLPTPRQPAEIIHSDGLSVLKGTARIVQRDGGDVTSEFISGAKLALELCLKHKIGLAILTESSPSCGSSTIYNGEFSGTKIAGAGVTSALLLENGIRVFSQHSIGDAEKYFNSLTA